MLKHVVFLLFLYAVKNVSSDSVASQESALDSKDISKDGIKKNEVGANGLEANWERITRNFRNPVLEYLLQKNSDGRIGPPQRGVVREIRHSQTLLVPNSLRSPLLELLGNQLPHFESQKNPEGTRNPDVLPIDNFWNFIKNKTQPGGSKLREKVISSPVLHLNKNPDEIKQESTRIQVYPAVAVVINTFDKDGSLRKSVTHFQPDFNSLTENEKNAPQATEEKSRNKNYESIHNSHRTVGNYVRETPGVGNHVRETPNRQEASYRQGISWPFGNYFPIVINDPYLSLYNTFATGMYNAVSSMIEYGPEADICVKERGKTLESEVPDSETVVSQHGGPSKLRNFDRYKEDVTHANVFDEVTMQSENFKRKQLARKRRDTTSIFVKSREGDTVDITLEEPKGSNSNQKISEGSDLILRKGGIAIAGPGGVATAYTGGTAIVGPYGTVYKSPEGTAILGPFSKVVNITDDTSFEEILKMHKEMQSQTANPGSILPNQHQGGVGFKNYRNFFSYMTNLPIKFEVKPQGRSFIKNRPKIMRLKEEGIVRAIEEIKEAEFRRIIQDMPIERKVAKDNETVLIFRPKSKAEAGRNGVALSAPTSHAILYPGQKTNIYFEPESVASAGPSGFAHAHSDLFVTFVRNNETMVLPEEGGRSLRAIFLKKSN